MSGSVALLGQLIDNFSIRFENGKAVNIGKPIFNYKIGTEYASGGAGGISTVDDYIKFNKLHNIKEYFFWGMEHFLLSCKYEEIVWVYIPELWMEISKKIFISLQEENLLSFYKQLDESLVSEVLAKFKDALDD